MEKATIVCCIEGGGLEDQCKLLISSLRHFGGVLATAPILAINGRRGPELSQDTVAFLLKHHVTLVKLQKSTIGFEWFNYSNKVKAIEYAQQAALTGQVIWLDSDIIITGDLNTLLLSEDEDVAVRIEPVMPSITPEDGSELNYWQSLAKIVGCNFSDIPWVESEGRIKLAYFNSGVIAWRRTSGFARSYVKAFVSLMNSRLAQSNGSFFAADQVIIAPVIAKENLRWRSLSRDDHRMVFPALLQSDSRSWHGSKLLHYSGSRSSERKPLFEQRLRAELPGVASWLKSNEPEHVEMGWPERQYARALKIWRNLHWRLYAALTKNARSMPASISPGVITILPD